MRKVKLNWLSVFGLSYGLSSVLGAVERPAELNEHPHQLKALAVSQDEDLDQQPLENEPAIAEKPFLGVGSQTVDETLASHLSLEHGVVVRTVHPDSGADQAGLKKHDILLSVDDKRIDSPFALRDAIQARSVGDEIEVSIVRGGEEHHLSIQLGARPEGIPGIGNFKNHRLGKMQQIWPNEQLPEEAREQMARIQEMIGEEFEVGVKLNQFLNEDLDEVLPLQGGEVNMNLEEESTVTWQDAEGEITMKMCDGRTEVTVRDQEGEIVFEGPWDTQVDKAAVDENIRQRIENLDVRREGNKLKLWMEAPRPEDNLGE